MAMEGCQEDLTTNNAAPAMVMDLEAPLNSVALRLSADPSDRLCEEFRPTDRSQPTFLTCLTFEERKHFQMRGSRPLAVGCVWGSCLVGCCLVGFAHHVVFPFPSMMPYVSCSPLWMLFTVVISTRMLRAAPILPRKKQDTFPEAGQQTASEAAEVRDDVKKRSSSILVQLVGGS